LLCAGFQANAQVTDDFSDGDLSINPSWQGDVLDFEVDANLELHLNAAAVENESHLSTPCDVINNATWDIKVRMEFNPSASNRAYIYLTSDQADLEADLNGYYVMVGNTTDEVSLYRQSGGSSTKIIDGIDGSVNLSLVELAVKVTRDESGNWELFSDVGLTGSYVSEGTAMDDTFSTSLYFGMLCDYTATRSALFYFDDISVTGNGFIDTAPPIVQSLQVIDEHQLTLDFNEELNPSSAEDVLNYDWNGENPISAVLSIDMVTLDFASSFPLNVLQNLMVSGIQDLAGNTMVTEDISFNYLVLGTAGPGDIVINEIMADPAPVIGLPDAEYVELFNASDSAFDLLGWNLRNTVDDEILSSFVLLPGEYVIICDDAFLSIFSAYGNVLVVTSLTALSNTGDDLHLFNPDGEIIDEVTYTTSWYGGPPFSDGGYSLERKNPFLPCSSASNWEPSSDASGGTPGTQNSLFIDEDTSAPSILSLAVIDANFILLTFDESMDELSLILASYILGPSGAAVAQSPQSSTEIFLEVNPALIPGSSYTLSISGPNDCTGNELVPIVISFIVPDEPEAGDVIFNEVMPDPSPALGLPELEYLEIFNRSDKNLDLFGWTLVNTATVMTFGTLIMGPGDYLIVCDDASTAALSAYGDVYEFLSFTALSNEGDDLYLYDASGELLDAITYDISWYHDTNKDEGGYSIERINPELPCSGSDNWAASQSTLGGTPGQENSVLDLNPDIIVPTLNSAILQGVNQVLVTFSESIQNSSIDLTDFSVSPSILVIDAEDVSANAILITLAQQLDTGIVYTLTVNGVSDCSGNEMEVSSASLAIPELHEDGDLIINEVLFNPYTGGYDFVEIYNRSTRTLSLKNWKMANRESGEMANVNTITVNEILIFPGEFKVVTEDPANITLNYPLGRSQQYIDIPDLPSYNDDIGNVLLLDPQITIQDEFYYSQDYQFTLIDDVNGVSLERVDYNRLTNDPTNWHSAAENVGWATPGYENSQLQTANNLGASFSVEPEVFSPDNDGYEDLLLINYDLEQTGQVLNVSVFDRHGRLVRLLTRNQYVGSRGTISWDGINEEGAKARIGVYILFIELFDLAGTVQSTKKTCVLGGRF